MNKLLITILLLVLTASVPIANTATWGKTDFGDLEWKQEDDGTKIANLWGTSNGPHGQIIQMPNGYSSGIRMYDNDYRAFVIKGKMTHSPSSKNNPPTMESGAFWVQPGGKHHVTKCKSSQGCLAYFEFENNASGLKAKTILSKNIPWWTVPNTGGAVKLAWVWGERESDEPSGFFLKFKDGFPGFPHAHTNNYEGVVLQGRYKHWEVGDKEIEVLPVGSSFWQNGGADHDDSCEASGKDCISYFRIHGKFDITPAKASGKK